MPKVTIRLPPFVPLLIETMDCPAWRALSHGARSLYVALKRRYNQKLHNNGRIYLPQRTAAKELRSHHNEIARWFRELQHYRFIEMTEAGFLGVNGHGRAPCWRLTELGFRRDFPTKDYLRWNGEYYDDGKAKAQTRAGKQARSVREKRHTDVQQNHTSVERSVREKPHKRTTSEIVSRGVV